VRAADAGVIAAQVRDGHVARPGAEAVCAHGVGRQDAPERVEMSKSVVSEPEKMLHVTSRARGAREPMRPNSRVG
jgi:hypothetical protein